MEQLGRRADLAREIRALGRDASARRAAGRYVAEGARVAADAVAAGTPIEQAVVTREWAASTAGRALLPALEGRATRLWWAEASVMEHLLPSKSPQGVALVLRRPGHDLAAALGAASLVTVVDALQEPGNLGTIARSSEAAGAGALLAVGGGVDPFHPRAVRGSAGALFRLPTVECTREAAIEALQRDRFELLALAAADGEALWESAIGDRVALLVGSEAHGLDAAWRGAPLRTLTIPMAGNVESLSVGAAAAIALFEIARRRR